MSLQKSSVFKILHQSHSIAQYHPKATQDILWPCLRFAISLLAKADQDLNLFESTLLRLLGEGENDLQQLSQQMGLTNEKEESSSLIDFLILKLQQLDLITDRLRVTDEGKQVLNKINDSETKVVSATVYFDLINCCWLPMISRGEPKVIHAEQVSGELIEFTQGSVGNNKLIKALPVLSDVNTAKAPDERDVIDIIKRSRQQRKKLEAHPGSARNDGFVPSRGTISINSEGELIYLHCYAFRVAGITSSYISDGFRSCIQERFSRGFNSYRNRENNHSIKAVHEKLYNESKKNYVFRDTQGTKSLKTLYQSLVNSKVENAIEQSEYENNFSSFVSKSYYKIEEMLSECYAFSKINNCISELSSEPQTNAKLAKKIALQLGFKFEDSKLVNTLLKAKKGSIVHLKADQPEMTSLLFCHLFIARSDKKQPMVKLAEEYPDLLSDIARLRSWRNSVDHGEANAIRTQLGIEEVNFIYQIVEQVRKILSDWLKENNDQVQEKVIPNWLKDDIRSEASSKLEKEFGLMLNRMHDTVYQGLFKSLLFSRLKDGRDRTNALASALQYALYQACRILDSTEVADIELVKQQLVNSGVEQITKSNPYKIRQALIGGNATLGANFIAFWAQITDQQQREIKGFLKTVDTLDQIRGHSGPILDQNDRLNEIQETIFKLIKILMEQYCG